MQLDLIALDSIAPGVHAMNYIKSIGVLWEVAVPVPLIEAWWFCGCTNLPDPLPACLSVSSHTTERITTLGYTIKSKPTGEQAARRVSQGAE